MSLVRVRIAFGEFVLLVLNSLASLIYLLEKAHQYRKLLRRLAFWLVNPRVLGVVLAIPSIIVVVTTANQVMTNQATWGSTTAQIMLLSIGGLTMSAPLIFTPYRNRGDSRINFNPS
jgi:hypothetical protein